MRRTILVLAMLGAFEFVTPRVAAADITGFLGFSPTPSSRSLRGVAFGVNLIVVGFELEYANISEDPVQGAPSLRTGMINGLVQTPTTKAQFYVTAGGGFFRETLNTRSQTSFGTNIGGGMKLGLVGPLRLRVDYRVFSLRGSALYKNLQRFYAGANISF